MGEYADMMLDGTCCSSCGVFMEDEAQGFPVMCDGCIAYQERIDRAALANAKEERDEKRKYALCPECGKRVKAAGISDHMRDVHGPKP